MAGRDSSHQPSEERRSLATGWGSDREVKIPLLPYERQLIEALGCTEEEYEEYRRNLINYGRVRPAEYAHIPDVRNDPVTIVVSLVVGLALSAASALLAPKPKTPERKENQRLKADDNISRSRFNNTQGFDNQQDISALGSPVPLFFGKFERVGNSEGRAVTHGGLLLQPQLVWSRMFSYGTHQGFLGGYIIGEVIDGEEKTGRYDRPELAGIQFGTSPLTAIDPSQYAIYWRSDFEDGRLKRTDLLYGTDGYPAAGNPEPNPDILGCPYQDKRHGPGFCMSYVPSGDVSFGVHSSIRNGQGWKLNFRIIPFPKTEDKSEKKQDKSKIIRAQRSKIVHWTNARRGQGMRGLGCGYSPFMGIVSKNGSPVNQNGPDRNVRCVVGDEIDFLISGKDITKDRYGGKIFGDFNSDRVEIGDIANKIDTLRGDADDALQIGEIFMIGRTLWQVIRRSGGNVNGAWEVEKAVTVTLRMVETTTNPDASQIGIAGKPATDRIVTWDGYRSARETGDMSEGSDKTFGWLGPAFWNLVKADFAVIKNTRPVASTEFGIRSQVWNQASGLCNFQTLPSSEDLEELEEDGDTITEGKTTKYFKRSSCFTIYLRPVGLREDGTLYPWGFLGRTFVVSGSQPVDQYNFIRLKTNLIANNADLPQMEWRFIPRSFADIDNTANRDKNFLLLDAKTGQEFGEDVVSSYGTWRLTWVGGYVPVRELFTNNEMLGAAFRGKCEEPTYTVRSIERFAWAPSNPSEGRSAAWNYEVFGDPRGNFGQVREGVVIHIDGNGNAIQVRHKARCILSPFSDYVDKFGVAETWDRFEVTVLNTSGTINNGVTVIGYKPISVGNYFAARVGLRGQVGYVARVTDVEIQKPECVDASIEREFEGRSQISEISLYDEVSKSCDSGAEHTITYINESIGPDNTDPDLGDAEAPNFPYTMMGVAVRSGNALNRLEQLNVWLGNGINTRLNAESAPDSAVRGPTNLFADVVQYILTNEVGGLGQYITPDFVDRDSCSRTAKFQKANGLYFDGAISDRNNARAYLTDVAPFHLCNFMINDGVFAVEPALPYNSSFKIDPYAINIAGYFNENNIIEDSYQLNYLDVNDRDDFRAVITYRESLPNTTPTPKTIQVRWNENYSFYLPQEEIDLRAFCTSQEHAEKVGRFLLSIRRRIDHTVTFKTDPKQLGLAPGALIIVSTTSAPQESTVNGVISADGGGILSVREMDDGVHEVSIYVPATEQAQTMEITVKNNRVEDEALWGSVFSLITPRINDNIYQIESLEVDEDGLAQVVAAHFPAVKLGTRWKSLVAEDVLDLNNDIFKIEL